MALAEYFALVKQIDFGYLYSVTKQWFLVGFTLLGPVTFTYDAPFGKFATPDSVLSVDGVKSWIVMELALGISPQFVLARSIVVHYLNRAIVSPLRTPSRSSSHLAVVSAAVAFNAPNGFLLAAFLTSASTASYLTGALSSARFWAGIALWAAGFAGNVYHDEILLNIRRKAIAKGKARELLDDDDRKSAQRPHYAIPHGGLYSLVSFPHYLCEWVEWFGFALAAGPFPGFALLPSAQVLLAAARSAQFAEAGRLLVPFMDSVSPPWVFCSWYYERFKESYPRERRAVIPWLL
ncbi:3-oxo-5-alpha-steroid 4-dehydrogenase-domain-containing protein [Lactarius hengduanensis]|nr:3-oxo-5-alpha-steroid 4-dehydrogenase-domain-containing protein [Lactarius hengduanensis]